MHLSVRVLGNALDGQTFVAITVSVSLYLFITVVCYYQRYSIKQNADHQAMRLIHH